MSMIARRTVRRAGASLALVALFSAAACGDGEDRPGQVTEEGGGSGSASGSVSGSVSASGTDGETTEGADGFEPVSDVAAHAAIGDDVAAIKELLAPAKEGGTVDWAGIRRLFEEGGASKRGDGTNRTLQALVEAPDVVAVIEAALTGSGDDAVRAQRVEKGITVLLARKVVDELAAAAEKVEAGETEAADGAPHNVDEAWAFFTAKGQGPAVTADKRAADFGKDGTVREPIIAALTAAQKAAGAGDAAALATATEAVTEGLHYVFYLATFKYLGADNAVGRAEGAAFYLGIQPVVAGADAAADKAIVAAFDAGDAAAGRQALHTPAVLAALGVEASEQVS